MKKILKDTEGFTLIELLVVVAIIGILAAIAIPQFASYRQRGFDAQANSDLRNAATSEEAYFATNSAYIGCTVANGSGCTNLPGFSAAKDTNLGMVDGGLTFTGTATSGKGSGKTFSYNSQLGGMQ
jgi:type IV pilus assembly protein PilA